MAGGGDGARGVSYLGRKVGDGTLRWINLGGSKEVDLKSGDRIKLCTPGGGGYGKLGEVNGFHVNGHGGQMNGYGAHIPRASGESERV